LGADGGVRSAAGADGGGSPAGELAAAYGGAAARAICRNRLYPVGRAGENVWPGERSNGESSFGLSGVSRL
jgi:hypothetical protein